MNEKRKSQQAEYRRTHKDNIAAHKAVYYQEHKERILARNAAWREKNREHDAANKAIYREKHKEHIAAYLTKYRKENREHLLAVMADWREKNKEYLTSPEYRDAKCDRARQEYLALRTAVYDMYGRKKEGHEHGVCSCPGCDADLMQFGTLSHIDGNGKRHRELTKRSPIKILKEALAVYDPTRFAAECFNCNLAAARNGGICPHKTENIKRTNYHVVVG